MENKKVENKNTGLIIILILIILGLAGYIVYDKVLVKWEEKNITSQNEVNDNEVNSQILNLLTDMIGLNNSGYSNDMCLNYYVSNNDYSKYAKEIMTYYGNRNDGKHRYFVDKGDDFEFCKGAADCDIILKDDAKQLVKLYNFSGSVTDYYDKEYNEYWYAFNTNYNMHGPCVNDLKINHDFSSGYINKNDVQISDIQIISSSEFEEMTKNVVYNFKLDENGNYYLSNVEVK